MLLSLGSSTRCLLRSLTFARTTNKPKLTPYEILGVNKDADQNSIKKAFYKLAQQYHPDKNSAANAKEKFAEINNAYEVLSDDSKRKSFDQTGSAEGPFADGVDYEDIFSHFASGGFGKAQQADFDPSIFGDLAGMFMGGMKGGKPHKSQPVDVVVNIDVDFKESVFGAEKDIRYFHRVVCYSCNGSKAKPGTKPKKCNSCHGKGSADYRQGAFAFKMACGACEGTGTVIRDFCPRCKGQGIEQRESTHKMTIPKGVATGTILRSAGRGSCNEEKEHGDLLVKVTVKPSPRFRRDGSDVISTLNVSLADAVLGTDVKIQTIYGESKDVIIPAGTQSGDKIKVMAQGFQKSNSTEKGVHYVNVAIEIPKKLTPRQKELFEELRGTNAS